MLCTYSVACDIRKLVEEKCHPPSKDHESWLIDPLKFVVDLPAHRDVDYVAVVSKLADIFVLHEVYQKQRKQVNATFDIVQPQRYLSNIFITFKKPHDVTLFQKV